ncbi:hypothetical protein SYNTR_1536 [Candidatus Syntrophocurvum alkaliphilum]|uniref:Flavin reductase like domain-containing protein n=1 Tax=Candidatus Syntrophocurvum alkaliphilum TaxID=2293317 RepID=A0A6I6DD72_9FIRM|nr:flavin reductase family protein [Candidatus Syntrophocurvum alkaliphilum]QGU00130.1 hypothetical protein SYNTR_1536 [Candidatus Syntrophocurvum alkaliphilum]
MKIDKKYVEYANDFLGNLTKGAFLTVKHNEKLNTMTIGWGSLGYMWQRPIVMVAVRYSRYSYELIEKANEFTVSIPLNSDLKKDLAIAGKKSGRDINKFKECNITAQDSKTINSPIVDECDLFFECKVVYKQAMEPGTLDKSIREKFYATHNYHVLYYGEILDCYKK